MLGLKTRNVRPSVAGPLFWRVLHWSTIVAPNSRATAALWVHVVDAMGCPACRTHFAKVISDRYVTTDTRIGLTLGVQLHGDVNRQLSRVAFPAGSLTEQAEVLQRRHCAGLASLCPREVASLLLMIAMGADLQGANPRREAGTAMFVQAMTKLVCKDETNTQAWRQLHANACRLNHTLGGHKRALFEHVMLLFSDVPGVDVQKIMDDLSKCAFAQQ